MPRYTIIFPKYISLYKKHAKLLEIKSREFIRRYPPGYKVRIKKYIPYPVYRRERYLYKKKYIYKIIKGKRRRVLKKIYRYRYRLIGFILVPIVTVQKIEVRKFVPHIIPYREYEEMKKREYDIRFWDVLAKSHFPDWCKYVELNTKFGLETKKFPSLDTFYSHFYVYVLVYYVNVDISTGTAVKGYTISLTTFSAKKLPGGKMRIKEFLKRLEKIEAEIKKYITVKTRTKYSTMSIEFKEIYLIKGELKEE